MATDALRSQEEEQLRAVLARLPAEEMGETMAGELLRAIPEIQRSTDEDFRAALVRSCSSNIANVWDGVLGDASDGPVTPPQDATDWAHELVRRGVELPGLLRAYRLGHWFLLSRVEQGLEEEEIDADLRWRVLIRVSNYSFAYIDAVSTQLVDEYERERAQWIRGAAAARAELVSSMLAGEAVDPRTATEKLRYDVTRRHLALIVWSDAAEGGASDGAAAEGSLERAASALAADLGGRAVLTVPIGGRVVWAWTSGGELVDTVGDGVPALPRGLRAAIGTCGDGPQGMIDSHRKAVEVRRVAELLHLVEGSVLFYEAVALTALITAVPALAVAFAESELGELAADDDATERLRETVRVYLDENLSAVRAGRRLHVHQNTVVYRIKRAEEVLGRAVDARRLELEVALQLAEGLQNLRALSA